VRHYKSCNGEEKTVAKKKRTPDKPRKISQQEAVMEVATIRMKLGML
jgi:hypothetical protein